MVRALAVMAAVLFPAFGFAEPGTSPTHQDIKKTLGLVPGFMRAMPEASLPGAWQAMKELELNPDTKVPGKYKELIGLAVAAQIPCAYCVYFHTEAAKLHGATSEELKEAIALSAFTRQTSTLFTGLLQNQTNFEAEIDRVMSWRKQQGNAQSGPGPAPVADAAAARAEMQRFFGDVPTFVRGVPESMLAGIWNEWKSLELNEQTAIPSRYKSLIVVAVGSQIPCGHCVYGAKKNALAAGASEDEVNEAVGMSALTRHWSTVLNGAQIDANQFRTETRRIMSYVKKQPSRSSGGGSTRGQ